MICCMNPPYGKSSSLCTPITTKVMELGIKAVSLTPDNMFKNDFLRSKLIDYSFDDPKEVFGLDTGGRLMIALLDPNVNNERPIEDIFLSEKEATLLKSIVDFNKRTKQTFWNIDGNAFGKKWNYELKDCNKKLTFPQEIANKKFSDCVKEQILFFKPLFWPCGSPKNVVDSYEGQYNIKGIWLDEFNKKHAGDVLVFRTKKERDNFYKWTTQHYGKNYEWIDVEYDTYLCGFIRKAIMKLIGQGAGAKYFNVYFPNLDWSKEWDDKAVLAELGLSEDFLYN